MFFRFCLLFAVFCWIQSQLIKPVKLRNSPCYRHQCPIGHRCKVINRKAICKCNPNCARSSQTGPLCSTTQKDYRNLCELKKEECLTRSYISVEHYGKCGTNSKCSDFLHCFVPSIV